VSINERATEGVQSGAQKRITACFAKESAVMTVPVFRFRHRLACSNFINSRGNNTVRNSRAYPQLYFFSAIDWHLSINACRSASVLKVGRIDCIPPPEQFVEFISGAPSPPPQLIKVALRAIINTRFLELINSSSFKIINNMAWTQVRSVTTLGCLV
jgi:hypothetical protein